MTVADELSGLVSGGGKAQFEDDVIQPAFEDFQEIIACNTGLLPCGTEVSEELAFDEPIGVLDLLFLSELKASFGDPSPAGAPLARGAYPALNCALGGKATVTFEEELLALPSA